MQYAIDMWHIRNGNPDKWYDSTATKTQLRVAEFFDMVVKREVATLELIRAITTHVEIAVFNVVDFPTLE